MKEAIEVGLGMKVRDSVSGFAGIAVSRTVFLNGCVRICVSPPLLKGATVEDRYFDEPQLEVVETETKVTKLLERRKTLVAAPETGGSRPDVKRQADVRPASGPGRR